MEELIELTELVSKQKVKKIEIIGNGSAPKSKLNEFYEGIISGEFKNDTVAANALYGTSPSNANYKKLKYRLQDRLINSVLFIDVNKPHFKGIQRAYYSCQKILSAVNILFGLNKKVAAISLAEKGLKKALEFEHTEIILSLSQRLSRHYGTMVGDTKKYHFYRDINRKYFKIYEAELLASDYFTELAFSSAKSGASQKEIEATAIKYSNHLAKYLDKIQSYQFLLMTYTVFWTRDIISNDYTGALKMCQKALGRIENKPNIPKKFHYVLHSRMLLCHLQLRQFDKGEVAFKNALEFIEEGEYNWFVLYRNYILLGFRSKEYQKAYDKFLYVNENKNFKKMSRHFREYWKILEAHFQFFKNISLMDSSAKMISNSPKFRLNKFLNELPMFSMDKRGVNIPILIIQVLFLLQQKKFGKVIDKVEALNAYCYRYLKKDDTFRSNCFIKMLLLLPKCNFHRMAVERKSKTLLAKLYSVPLEVARQSAEIEIVPYEDLWEIVMNMLDDKFYKKL